jgi:catechol 2,3-dioxygenase-like lactoylglutathione lyase family enzyme
VHEPNEEDVMLPRLMYVTLYVRDQDRALEFSTERLGLHKRVDNPLLRDAS